MKPSLAVIALGSNLGDSQNIVRAAMRRLEAFAAGPMRCSSLWQTSPLDCPPGSPDFINAVVAFEPRRGETAESLLLKLQTLEGEFGRKPKQTLNEARPLDLDLIAFGDEMRSSEALILPHPRTHQRRFVLEPLREILPGYVLPGQTEPVETLLARLPAQKTKKALNRR